LVCILLAEEPFEHVQAVVPEIIEWGVVAWDPRALIGA
jgi:hypothetical protein